MLPHSSSVRSPRHWPVGLVAALLVSCFVDAGPANASEATARPAPIKVEGTPVFRQAEPVWLAGRETERNLTVGFRAVFDAAGAKRVRLVATGSTIYRVFLNGAFVGYGPARGPHGWYRVDDLDLAPRLQRGRNVLAVEVAGYNVNSYYLLDQPSFLQAEVVADGRVLAATGGAGEAGRRFEAGPLSERVTKVQRYSFQRPFSEVYRLTPGFDRWRAYASTPLASGSLQVQPTKTLLPRRVAYPEYRVRPAWRWVGQGGLRFGQPVPQPWKDRSLTTIGPQLGGYPEAELATVPSLELQSIATTELRAETPLAAAGEAWPLKAGAFRIADFGTNLTGFIGLRVRCREAARLFLAFDEILTEGDVDFKRLGCVNVVSCEFAPGEYTFESFEPYTLRYLKLLGLAGDCEISAVQLREYASPIPAAAHFLAGDERLNRLFAAGVETFRQNALDVFMDCPSRERAGWLCDSYFTARVGKDLLGDAAIERNLFENYRLPERFAALPDGMLPMCYPADHNDGVFIPNWAMWFVVELEEYLARSGDRATVRALEPRLLKLLAFLQRFRNSDGLLEQLPSWVFVEWSKANDFVQDVNYPSNMLYAEVLAALGRLYQRDDLTAEAGRVRETIRRQAFDGTFFVDNAVRREGRLEVTRNRSEVCQYFAFYFHVATPETQPALWQTLVRDFGPQRKQTKAFPEVHPANAFVGNVLRLELLARAGLAQQVLDESLAYQLYMADRTGTLWENDGAYASCNHGFASHGGVHVLYRDVLGLADVDVVKRVVTLRFNELKLDQCEGSLPVPGGRVSVLWHKENGGLRYRAEVPRGYRIQVENRSGLPLRRERD